MPERGREQAAEGWWGWLMLRVASAVQRLEKYFQRIGEVLGEESRCSSFAIYAMGLLGDAERKSVEPIAARACPDPTKTDALHQRLLLVAPEHPRDSVRTVCPTSRRGRRCPQREQEPLWLLIEWRDGEPEPANDFLVSLPEFRTIRQLIRLVMQRWRTERASGREAHVL
jgi:hypothetical protein